MKNLIMNTSMNFMRLGYVMVVCFFIDNVAAFTDAQKSEIQSKLVHVGLQCIREYPLSISDIRAFKNKMMPNGDNPKCFAACLFKKIGVMDNMGMISPDKVRDNAKKIFKGNEEHLKSVDGILGKCSAVNQQNTRDGKKGCDRAKLVFECFTKNAPNYGFDFDF